MNKPLTKRRKYKKTRFYVDNEVLETHAQNIGPHGVALYAALARHANSESQECFPSYPQLMQLSGIGNRGTINNYLKILEAEGLIYKFHKQGDRRNYYSLLHVDKEIKRVSTTTDPTLTSFDSSTCDANPYQIQHSGSTVRDTLSHITESDKEINSSLKDETQNAKAAWEELSLKVKNILNGNSNPPLSTDEN